MEKSNVCPNTDNWCVLDRIAPWLLLYLTIFTTNNYEFPLKICTKIRVRKTRSAALWRKEMLFSMLSAVCTLTARKYRFEISISVTRRYTMYWMSVSEFYSSHLFFDSIKNRKLPVLPPQMTGKYLFVFVLRAMKGSTVLIFCLQHFNICNTLHHFISHICLYIEGMCIYIILHNLLVKRTSIYMYI